MRVMVKGYRNLALEYCHNLHDPFRQRLFEQCIRRLTLVFRSQRDGPSHQASGTPLDSLCQSLGSFSVAMVVYVEDIFQDGMELEFELGERRKASRGIP